MLIVHSVQADHVRNPDSNLETDLHRRIDSVLPLHHRVDFAVDRTVRIKRIVQAGAPFARNVMAPIIGRNSAEKSRSKRKSFFKKRGIIKIELRTLTSRKKKKVKKLDLLKKKIPTVLSVM